MENSEPSNHQFLEEKNKKIYFKLFHKIIGDNLQAKIDAHLDELQYSSSKEFSSAGIGRANTNASALSYLSNDNSFGNIFGPPQENSMDLFGELVHPEEG